MLQPPTVALGFFCGLTWPHPQPLTHQCRFPRAREMRIDTAAPGLPSQSLRRLAWNPGASLELELVPSSFVYLWTSCMMHSAPGMKTQSPMVLHAAAPRGCDLGSGNASPKAQRSLQAPCPTSTTSASMSSLTASRGDPGRASGIRAATIFQQALCPVFDILRAIRMPNQEGSSRGKRGRRAARSSPAGSPI
ncbi:uncharacterized protein LAESUDRAFT_230902 [Laetiporus sulphureus 93-53]|uniref:Uncharacterized protein n=1 Tax=Laetiporus sulphureus 93-53 TaxID=1314785 RepID=A0A165DQX7_9APHY|nr:uncharacterized protein LAESUDRAFT_230902 [Laetiporus sulphureus 93-53]KZT05435.1 hypothetical protein LAESUDRAFT_230902 [Laetiporus sulphureus 93-53]